MTDILVQIVFGFPGAFLSLLVSVVGVLKEKFWLVMIGAILLVPYSYYLNGAPGSRGFVIFLPLFQVAAAFAVRKKSKLWAWLLFVPAFFAVFWVLGLALFYQMR